MFSKEAALLTVSRHACSGHTRVPKLVFDSVDLHNKEGVFAFVAIRCQ